jgi:hypothetical protein
MRHAANYNKILPIDRNFVTHCQFFELAERNWQKHELAERVGTVVKTFSCTIKLRFKFAAAFAQS